MLIAAYAIGSQMGMLYVRASILWLLAPENSDQSGEEVGLMAIISGSDLQLSSEDKEELAPLSAARKQLSGFHRGQRESSSRPPFPAIEDCGVNNDIKHQTYANIRSLSSEIEGVRAMWNRRKQRDKDLLTHKKDQQRRPRRRLPMGTTLREVITRSEGESLRQALQAAPDGRSFWRVSAAPVFGSSHRL
jgi:hypothetical protein